MQDILDDKIVIRADDMIKTGSRSKAEKLLKRFVSNIPSNWNPVSESEDKIRITFWDMTEFLVYVQNYKKSNPQKNLEWTGPSYSHAFYLLAFIAVEKNDWTTALEYVVKGLTLEPDHPELLSEKAFILHKLGHHEKAYDLYTKAIDVRPWVPDHYRARALKGAGVALKSLNRHEEGRKMLDKALKLEHEIKVRTEKAALENERDIKKK